MKHIDNILRIRNEFDIYSMQFSEAIIVERLTAIEEKYPEDFNDCSIFECVWIDLKYPPKVTPLEDVELPDYIKNEIYELFQQD